MTLLSDHSNDYFARQELVAIRVKKDLKDHPVKFGYLMAKALVERSLTLCSFCLRGRVMRLMLLGLSGS